MELKIRIGREWTWFKDIKQFVLMTSSKLWNISLPNILFQKTFLFTCFGKEKPHRAQHPNRKGMGLFWGPQKICYASRKPWNIFPQTGLLKSIFVYWSSSAREISYWSQTNFEYVMEDLSWWFQTLQGDYLPYLFQTYSFRGFSSCSSERKSNQRNWI